MSTLAGVNPGDWFVVDPSGTEQIFRWVELGERIIDNGEIRRQKRKGKPTWGHAGIASRRLSNGTLMIVEAEPGGAVERPWHWEAQPHLWSIGTGLSVPAMAKRALAYSQANNGKGVPYSFLDYAAIEAHFLHLNVPGLQGYIESSGHMICSQLVDQCAMDCNVHLFDDDRWCGYVTPLDLGLLLEAHFGFAYSSRVVR